MPVPPPDDEVQTTPWRSKKIPGNPAGMLRYRRRLEPEYDENPFHSTNIPCNPDMVGSVNVSESVESSVQFSIDVSASFGAGYGPVSGAISAAVGMSVTESKRFEVSETLYGEKCRSVKYQYFIEYSVFEVTVVAANDSDAKLTEMTIKVPIGWYKTKVYVQPSCCTATSKASQLLLVGAGREVGGLAGKQLLAAAGLVGAGRDFIANGHMTGALVSFRMALATLPSESAHTMTEEAVGKLFTIAENIISPMLRDSTDPTMAPMENLAVMSEVHALSARASRIAQRARLAKYGDMASAMADYAAVFELLTQARLVAAQGRRLSPTLRYKAVRGRSSRRK